MALREPRASTLTPSLPCCFLLFYRLSSNNSASKCFIMHTSAFSALSTCGHLHATLLFIHPGHSSFFSLRLGRVGACQSFERSLSPFLLLQNFQKSACCTPLSVQPRFPSRSLPPHRLLPAICLVNPLVIILYYLKMHQFAGSSLTDPPDGGYTHALSPACVFFADLWLRLALVCRLHAAACSSLCRALTCVGQLPGVTCCLVVGDFFLLASSLDFFLPWLSRSSSPSYRCFILPKIF